MPCAVRPVFNAADCRGRAAGSKVKLNRSAKVGICQRLGALVIDLGPSPAAPALFHAASCSLARTQPLR